MNCLEDFARKRYFVVAVVFINSIPYLPTRSVTHVHKHTHTVELAILAKAHPERCKST